ncbi:MAG: GNAT family N-acetyltransferase [Pseudanabaena sp. M135S2SP2A07QC]|jgi:diamine N-acetyltransferase|uniref:GNAT family N-acetyltransferase n=1 Tax=unclassified Microcystis TaxID=2643300 RepID=UPI002589DA5B|nr:MULTISPECIES: GNAT family protein [unclassified Microcystis]MCA6534547.1 GNAT family N-acetyltransferase [Pseudanabaena sp. M176S2SP2A07QC]MCA6537256.1 GNAT family N-acetyltransferase [Pseudanabaena sp. M037S2SP2A07QC]MCA6548974.1 GNAT family N-acetyltransferase [Pseudanabaena sp. M152S2SP2A07QC]MCA6553353.1 GNAT family N-acetyltransferase [Pseudanabaena sp. M135S2SP2A07QC]MCA6564861.1 GNAT family N-acetyltransferase [Pseudanabaena sp. M151S2SP2A07QC]MCA6571195.1 GNAT family N-acetyltransf
MLTTNKTLLRYPLPEDKELLVKLRNDIDLQVLLMSRPKANNLSKIESWLNQKLSDEHTVFFIVADSYEGFPVGYIQLVKMDFLNKKCELGICIDIQHQGKGYATDAFKLLEIYAKKIFNMNKIIVSVLVKNKRAISFYEKMLYQNVGILKADFYFDSEFHDVLLMEKII